jgi:hypothetical protein
VEEPIMTPHPAGIGSIYPLKQLGTGVLLILLTLFNAVMNLRQRARPSRPSPPCRR